MPRILTILFLLSAITVNAMEPQRKPQDEPLLDWSLWQKYRATVAHPAATVKPADMVRARANLERYKWAQQYRDGLVRNAKQWMGRISPEFLAQMIPATTPGDTLFTPCPACRDLGKPAHPHGQWKWKLEDPEKLTCVICGTVFPNEKYPESIVFHAKYGGGQTLTFCAAEPFKIFNFSTRPSFSANIRAQKVRLMANACRLLGETCALTGDPEYARATRLILLRLAEVYPNWLVHTGYGEYADIAPHVAALNIKNLPADEITPPPNKPNRDLHSGYWQGGRASGVGMEAGFVRQMVEAYDFTCDAKDNGQPIFTDADRLKIEKDLLLESTVLLVADKAVNNKSVGNATAVALVGICLGHPGMVRFGLDVFMKTVDGWFLPDGGTSESWGYANMTLGGIESLAQAFRGYTDPPGYADASGSPRSNGVPTSRRAGAKLERGKRIENLDLYHDTAYKKVWAAMFNGLQGDLNYPPFADSHRTTGAAVNFVELMADNYPEDPQYLALLKALAGDDLARGYAHYAIYYREPGLDTKPAPPLSFPDYVYPSLQIGYLRSGETGRDSALCLSASDWGNHHHLDSLGLYYWQGKHELLSDLGYLWDHPMSMMTRRTFAHSTVIVDGADQITKGRGGKFSLFSTSGKIKVMEAESKAYSQAALYRRTVTQVEHEPGRQYVADIFRVQGGSKHDYVFHGPNNDMQPQTPALHPVEATYDLKNPRASTAPAPWKLTWKLAADMHFSALWFNAPGETSLLGDGWGQRDYRNSDVGATLPYILRRRVPLVAGNQCTVFATVFEAFAPGKALVKAVKSLDVPAAESDNTVAFVVDTDAGADFIVSCLQARPVRLETPVGPLEMAGRFAVVSVRDGKLAASALVEGTLLCWLGQDITAESTAGR